MVNRRNTVTRQVWFYRAIDDGNDDPDWLFQVGPVLQEVDALPFAAAAPGQATRVVNHGEVSDLCAWIDTLTPRGTLRFGTIRKGAFPVVVLDGARRPLALADREGLLEEIHVQFLPDNLIGVIFNFYGPRLPTLGRYFKQTAPSMGPNVRFARLAVPDLADRLDRLRDFTLVHIEVRRTHLQVLETLVPGLSAAFDAQNQLNTPDTVALTLRTDGRSPRRLGAGIADTVKAMVGLGGIPEVVEAFKVRAFDPDTGRIDELDVLKEHMVATEEVVLQDQTHRVLDEGSAYRAIGAAYEARREELIRAPTLG